VVRIAAQGPPTRLPTASDRDEPIPSPPPQPPRRGHGRYCGDIGPNLSPDTAPGWPPLGRRGGAWRGRGGTGTATAGRTRRTATGRARTRGPSGSGPGPCITAPATATRSGGMIRDVSFVGILIDEGVAGAGLVDARQKVKSSTCRGLTRRHRGCGARTPSRPA
jgi:hypothetical protein